MSESRYQKVGESFVELTRLSLNFGRKHGVIQEMPTAEETYEKLMTVLPEIEEFTDTFLSAEEVFKRQNEFDKMLEDYRKNGPDSCPCGLPPNYCQEICGIGIEDND